MPNSTSSDESLPNDRPTGLSDAASQQCQRQQCHFWQAAWFWGAVLLLVLLLIVAWWAVFGQEVTNSEMLADSDKDPIVYEPVQYDVASWQASMKLATIDSQAVIKQIGSVALLESGLDVTGQPAKLYRYHAKQQVPMYVIDSDDFFELAWYYALLTDNKEDKEASLRYAKKAYAVATSVLGQTGATVIADMLANPTSSPKPLSVANAPLAANATDKPVSTVLVLHECQDYLCRLVFDKRTW